MLDLNDIVDEDWLRVQVLLIHRADLRDKRKTGVGNVLAIAAGR